MENYMFRPIADIIISTPSYLYIHSRNRHPTKLNLTNARKW